MKKKQEPKRWKFTFTLPKHRGESGFTYESECIEAELQGEKENIAMMFEESYGTPVKCTKVEEINS